MHVTMTTMYQSMVFTFYYFVFSSLAVIFNSREVIPREYEYPCKSQLSL